MSGGVGSIPLIRVPCSILVSMSIVVSSLVTLSICTDNALATEGSLYQWFYDGFEGTFPGDSWYVGDLAWLSGSDYWGDTSFKHYAGSWSCWCAQNGYNSYYSETPNSQVNCYDNNMDAYLQKKYSVNMRNWDVAYVDFSCWHATEDIYDYLVMDWWNGYSWVQDSNYILQGDRDWTRYYWKTPYQYMLESGCFRFVFHSDSSAIDNGAYLDEVRLIEASIVLSSECYISSSTVYPGQSFTLYYRIHNPAPLSLACGLGATVGTNINDPSHDVIVSIPSGYSWYSRTFTVPASTAPGTYDVTFGIWSGSPGDTSNGNRQWSSIVRPSSLTVLEPATSDLVWTDIRTDPVAPVCGEWATILCDLKNQGTTTSMTFSNHFYIDGAYDSVGTNYGLAGGQSFTWSFSRVLSPGYHDVGATADVWNQISEIDEYNNHFEERIWWKSPDLVVEDIWTVDSYGTETSVITSGQPFTVNVRIRNVGDADVTGSFRVVVSMENSQWSGTADCNGLASGSPLEIFWNDVYVSSVGLHTIRAVVDELDSISEANKATGERIGTAESNNERVESINIQKACWTVLAYLDADTDWGCEYSAMEKLSELFVLEAYSSPLMSVVVQIDRGPNWWILPGDYDEWEDCKRFFVTHRDFIHGSENLMEMGEVNMGDGDTLTSFLSWGSQRFVSEYYLVILCNHGGAWLGTCNDDTSGSDRLSLAEVRESLTSMKQEIGRNIDVIFFDSCLMGTLEVAYDASVYADYMVAAETITSTIPLDIDLSTFPYARPPLLGEGIIQHLRGNPYMTPSEFAVAAIECSGYGLSYQSGQCIASYDLRRMERIAECIDYLSSYLISDMQYFQPYVEEARTECVQLYESAYIAHMIDLVEFIENLESNVPDATLQEICQEILDIIGPPGGDTESLILIERHWFADNCHGMSIHFPQDVEYDSDYSESCLLSSLKHWDDLVIDYSCPQTVAHLAGTCGVEDWYRSSVTVTLEVLRSTHDVEFSYYRVDGEEVWTRYVGPFAVINDGAHTIEYGSVDEIGNNECVLDSNSIEFGIDTVVPSNPSQFASSHQIGVLNPDNTIWVEWSGAQDTLSGIQGYSVVWDERPDTIPSDIMDTNDDETNSNPLPYGSWYLHVRTTDNAGNWASGAYHIGPFLVGDVNQHPPSAMIEGTLEGFVGQSLSFDGSQSYDNDGSIIAYAWDFGDGSSATGSTANHIWSEAGVYTVTLTVTDNDGLAGSASVPVTILSNSEGDSYEPDDEYSQATLLSSGEVQEHSIHESGSDIDWMYIILTESCDIVVETCGSSHSDTVMRLYDSVGVPDIEIAFDDDSGLDYWSRIERSALAPGTYYVQITEFGMNDEIPQYSISLATQPTSSPSDPGDTSSLVLSSGTGSFAGVSESCNMVSVSPGEILSGDATMTTMNAWAPSAIMCLIGTTSWGVNSESYWTVGYVVIGTSSYTSVGITVTAPSEPGDYYLIFAFRAEGDGGAVASATNWAYGSPVWDDGNDIADFDSHQIESAQESGRAPINWLLESGYELLNVPADVITVRVITPGPPILTLSTTTDKTCYTSGETVEITMMLENSGGESATLTFFSSCKAYFIVTDAEGLPIYDLSLHMIVIWMITELVVDSGETVEFRFDWDLVDDLESPLVVPADLMLTGVVPGYFEDSTSLAFNPAPATFTLCLESGWNLVSIPLLNSTTRASNLGLETGDMIVSWNSLTQSYNDEYVMGVSPPEYDFDLLQGYAYQIWVSSSRKMVLQGCSPEVLESVYMDIEVGDQGGWLCIGLTSIDDTLHASDLASFVTGGSALYVCRWNCTACQYEDYVVGVSPPEYDFMLIPGEGYWIWVSNDCTISYCP